MAAELLPDFKKFALTKPTPEDTRQKRAVPGKEPRAGEEIARPEKKAIDRPPKPPEEDMERFRLEVGKAHGVKPDNIIGALASEAMLESDAIGRIEIHDDYSTIDLPQGMPRDLFRFLKKVRVVGQRLRISRLADGKTHGKKTGRHQGGHKQKGAGKSGGKHKKRTA